MLGLVQVGELVTDSGKLRAGTLVQILDRDAGLQGCLLLAELGGAPGDLVNRRVDLRRPLVRWYRLNLPICVVERVELPADAGDGVLGLRRPCRARERQLVRGGPGWCWLHGPGLGLVPDLGGRMRGHLYTRRGAARDEHDQERRGEDATHGLAPWGMEAPRTEVAGNHRVRLGMPRGSLVGRGGAGRG